MPVTLAGGPRVLLLRQARGFHPSQCLQHPVERAGGHSQLAVPVRDRDRIPGSRHVAGLAVHARYFTTHRLAGGMVSGKAAATQPRVVRASWFSDCACLFLLVLWLSHVQVLPCAGFVMCRVIQRRRALSFFQNGSAGGFEYTQPRIHAMVYDPANGQLRALSIDFRALMDELNGICELYNVPKKVGPC